MDGDRKAITDAGSQKEEVKPMKSMKAMKAKSAMKAATGAMKASKGFNQAAKRAMKAATGAMKSGAMKSAAGDGRGSKDPSVLRFVAGSRAPFWYGRSKVYTNWDGNVGRWRVYKVSPRDKVETGFGFHDRTSAKQQWAKVVTLLKRVNP